MKLTKIISSLLLITGSALMITLAFGSSFPVTLSILFLLSLLPFTPRHALKTVVSNPLIGRAKQSMGGVTFSTWKGINVLKNKATTVANPNSDGQLSQRSAFSQMVIAFRAMPAAIRAGFKKLAVKKSEFNAFASANLDNAWDRSVPGIATLIPANILVSKGTIGNTAYLTHVVDESSATVAVTFLNTITQPGQSLTDQAILCAYDSTINEWIGEATTAARLTGAASIPLPVSWTAGDVVEVYLGFYNPLSGESSDSQAASTTIVP